MSSAGREVVLVSMGELGSGAWEAHVLGLARHVSPHALVHLVAFASPGLYATSAGRARIERERRRAAALLSGEVAVLPHDPRFRAPAWSAWLLRRAVARVRRGRDPVVLHCRGYLAALAARGSGSGLVLHDVRAWREAEVRAFGGELPADEVARREAAACRGADAHACVSIPLRDLLAERHGVRADVFPCAADTARFVPDEEERHERRHHLGVGERLLIGFSGSFAGWQRPDALPVLLRAVRQAHGDAALLVLTPEVPAWRASLARAGLLVDSPDAPMPGADAVVRHVPHDDVPSWLRACDLTALLRDGDDVNLVASPIKFGESLACGVPVVVTEGLGDTSDLVRELGVGAVVTDALLRGGGDMRALSVLLGRIGADRLALADACRRAAVGRWSWHEQVPRWLALYDRVLSKDASHGDPT